MSFRRIKVLEAFKYGDTNFGEGRLVRVTMELETILKRHNPEKLEVIDIRTKEVLWPVKKEQQKEIKKPRTRRKPKVNIKNN